jgi:hypothetical protein
MEAEKTVGISLQMPERLKVAIDTEAKRRMTTASALIREQLIIFLPENIGNQMEAGKGENRPA